MLNVIGTSNDPNFVVAIKFFFRFMHLNIIRVNTKLITNVNRAKILDRMSAIIFCFLLLFGYPRVKRHSVPSLREARHDGSLVIKVQPRFNYKLIIAKRTWPGYTSA